MMRSRIIFDGRCPFCRHHVERLKKLDRHGILEWVDLHTCGNLKEVHPSLNKEAAMRQVHLVEDDGRLYGGGEVFQRLCLKLPVLWVLIPVVFFPGMHCLGPLIYRAISGKRYAFHQKVIAKKSQKTLEDI